jgi:hypothetical protein
MKIITIYEEGIQPVTLKEDSNDQGLLEYAQSLTPLMSQNNIMLFHTSTESVLVRPHKINAIKITEDETTITVEEPESAVEEKKEEEHIDILTDYDK